MKQTNMMSARLFIETEKIAQADDKWWPCKANVKARGDTKNVYSECRIWNLIDIISYVCNFTLQAFFIKYKLLSVTSRLLKIIKFHATGKFIKTTLNKYGIFHNEILSHYWYSLFWHNSVLSVHAFLKTRKSISSHTKISFSPLLKTGGHTYNLHKFQCTETVRSNFFLDKSEG